MIKYFRDLFVNTWRNAERSSIESNSVFKDKFVNVPVIVILVYIAFGLSVVRYYGNTDLIIDTFGKHLNKAEGMFYSYFYNNIHGEFHQKLWWVSTIILIYLVIPLSIIKLGFRQRLCD